MFSVVYCNFRWCFFYFDLRGDLAVFQGKMSMLRLDQVWEEVEMAI